jgi:hypothetical protein
MLFRLLFERRKALLIGSLFKFHLRQAWRKIADLPQSVGLGHKDQWRKQMASKCVTPSFRQGKIR